MLSLSASRTALRAVLRASASSSTVRYDSTRFYSSTMHDNDPEVLEREKQRNLSGKQHHTSTPLESAPGWNESLASASEASVKADKAGGTLADLQSKTVEYLRARHADPDNREESTSAVYARDEVTGPLGSVRVKEELLVEERIVPDDEPNEGNRMTPSEEDVKADRGEI